MSSENPKRRVVAINGSGGAYTQITASRYARYVEISECPADAGAFTGAFSAQGLNYQLPDDNFTETYGLIPGDTFSLGESSYTPRGRCVGRPQQADERGNVQPATVYFQAKSATVTATHVQVLEWS